MKCPYCQHEDLKVTDSRNASEINAVRRRRECLGCHKRFTTFESIDVSLQVKKRDGTYEDFEQGKLIKGLQAACHHSRISYERVRKIADEITNHLIEKQLPSIDAEELGEIVMDYLQKEDVIAYIRFACVYKRFKDIDELVEAIRSVTPKDAPTHPLREEDYAIKKK